MQVVNGWPLLVHKYSYPAVSLLLKCKLKFLYFILYCSTKYTGYQLDGACHKLEALASVYL